MQSISTMWLAHRDAELATLAHEEMTETDPSLPARIAFHDAARKVALGIERGELNPGDVMAEVDQFFLKLQDFTDELRAQKKRSETETANDPS